MSSLKIMFMEFLGRIEHRKRAMDAIGVLLPNGSKFTGYECEIACMGSSRLNLRFLRVLASNLCCPQRRGQGGLLKEGARRAHRVIARGGRWPACGCPVGTVLENESTLVNDVVLRHKTLNAIEEDLIEF
jgi:hypothetical protein